MAHARALSMSDLIDLRVKAGYESETVTIGREAFEALMRNYELLYSRSYSPMVKEGDNDGS